MRYLKKVVLGLILTFVVVTSSVGVYVYHRREALLKHALKLVKKQSQWPIHIKKLHLDLWRNFPAIAVVLEGVSVRHLPPLKSHWLRAKQLTCTFKVWNILAGKYIFDRVLVKDGLVEVPLEEKKTPKKKDNGSLKDVGFESLHLSNVKVKLVGREEKYVFVAKDITSQVNRERGAWVFQVNGDAEVISIDQKGITYLRRKPLLVNGKVSYANHQLTIYPSNVDMSKAKLRVLGNWHLRKDSFDLKIEGDKAPLAVLWPAFWEHKKQAPALSPKGKIAFQVHLNRKGKSKPINTSGTFVWEEGTIETPQVLLPIQMKRMKGHFTIPDWRVLHLGEVTFTELAGSIGGGTFSTRGVCRNFNAPQYEGSGTASLAVAPLAPFLSRYQIGEPKGEAAIQWTGTFHWKAPLAKPFELNGKFDKLSFVRRHLHYQHMSGLVKVKKSGKTHCSISGKVGKSDFSIRGSLDQIRSWKEGGKEVQKAYVKLTANHLQLDELITQPAVKKGGGVSIRQLLLTKIPRWAKIYVHCDMGEVQYRRFVGKHIRGLAIFQHQLAKLKDLRVGSASGHIRLNATLRPTSSSDIQAGVKLKMQNVKINELFHSCENFQQNFVRSEHLEGSLFSNAQLQLQLNSQGRPLWNSLEGEVKMLLKKGVLRNFEPLQHLSKYVKKEDLKAFTVDEIRNTFEIKDQMVHIPPMAISSNVTRIVVSGTHSFENDINYEFIVPFKRSFKRKDKDQAFGKIEDDSLSGMLLFLKLRGNADHYTHSLNFGKLGSQLIKKFFKQTGVLKDLLIGNYKPKKKEYQGLSQDEYFDFEDE